MFYKNGLLGVPKYWEGEVTRWVKLNVTRRIRFKKTIFPDYIKLSYQTTGNLLERLLHSRVQSIYPFMWWILCYELDDDPGSAMRRRHLISKTNCIADLPLWTHHPGIYKVTETHLGACQEGNAIDISMQSIWTQCGLRRQHFVIWHWWIRCKSSFYNLLGQTVTWCHKKVEEVTHCKTIFYVINLYDIVGSYIYVGPERICKLIMYTCILNCVYMYT